VFPVFQVIPLASRRPRLWLAAPLALVLGCGLAASVSALAPIVAAHATPEPDAEAYAANGAWWSALVRGTPTAVGSVLAPEFQLMRADGSAWDRETFLATGLPRLSAIPAFRDMTATRKGDLLVTRYTVTLPGEGVARDVPRLTVFRHEGGKWLVVADANFAAARSP
jgi:hypothetical protein